MGVRPVDLDGLLSSRATALPPRFDGGHAPTAHAGVRALQRHRLGSGARCL